MIDVSRSSASTSAAGGREVASCLGAPTHRPGVLILAGCNLQLATNRACINRDWIGDIWKLREDKKLDTTVQPGNPYEQHADVPGAVGLYPIILVSAFLTPNTPALSRIRSRYYGQYRDSCPDHVTGVAGDIYTVFAL